MNKREGKKVMIVFSLLRVAPLPYQRAPVATLVKPLLAGNTRLGKGGGKKKGNVPSGVSSEGEGEKKGGGFYLDCEKLFCRILFRVVGGEGKRRRRGLWTIQAGRKVGDPSFVTSPMRKIMGRKGKGGRIPITYL